MAVPRGPRRRYYRVTNWERYQHYGQRNPPWIKFYTSLLDDEDLTSLPIPTQLLFDRLLLLAARTGNTLKIDSKLLSNDLRLPLRVVQQGLPLLVKGGWIKESAASTRKRANASTRREEKKELSPTVVEGESSSSPYTDEPDALGLEGRAPDSSSSNGHLPEEVMRRRIGDWVIAVGWQLERPGFEEELARKTDSEEVREEMGRLWIERREMQAEMMGAA